MSESWILYSYFNILKCVRILLFQVSAQLPSCRRRWSMWPSSGSRTSPGGWWWWAARTRPLLLRFSSIIYHLIYRKENSWVLSFPSQNKTITYLKRNIALTIPISHQYQVITLKLFLDWTDKGLQPGWGGRTEGMGLHPHHQWPGGVRDDAQPDLPAGQERGKYS